MQCRRCGSELKPGAKFCNICGIPVQGTPMPNPQAGGLQGENAGAYMQQPMMGMQGMYGQPFGTRAADFTRSIFGKIVDLVKSPVTAGERLIRAADIKTSVIIILLQGILNAVFVMAAEHKLFHFIDTGINLAGDLSFEEGETVAKTLSIPYFRILIITVLLSLGLSCGLALLMMAGNKIIKTQVSFAQMLSAAAVRSAVLIPAILVSVVLFEIFWQWGIFLFILINIWGFVSVVLSGYSMNKDKRDMFALMISIVILLFLAIVMFTLSKIWASYLPDILRSSINALEKMSWEDILNEIM